jgi:hypothetical protein
MDHTSSGQFKVNYGEKPFKFDLSEYSADFSENVKDLETADEAQVAMDLSSFINKEEASDVILLTCDKKKIFGHKLILTSRSSVLNDLLMDPKVTSLEIPYDYEVVMRCVEYLYSGATNLTKKNWEIVLKCSDKYEIVGLRKMCFEFIVKSLNKHSVLEYMKKAQNKGKFFFKLNQKNLILMLLIY